MILRLLALASLLLTLSVATAVAMLAFVLIEGGASPPDCAPSRPGPLEEAARSLVFDAKLATFIAGGSRPPVTTVAFDEAEASARAARYFADASDRVSGVLLCFKAGEIRGFMRIDTGFGRQVGVGGRGTVDLGGGSPVVRLESADVGGLRLPGFARRLIERRVNGDLKAVRLVVPLRVDVEEGRAILSRAR